MDERDEAWPLRCETLLTNVQPNPPATTGRPDLPCFHLPDGHVGQLRPRRGGHADGRDAAIDPVTKRYQRETKALLKSRHERDQHVEAAGRKSKPAPAHTNQISQNSYRDAPSSDASRARNERGIALVLSLFLMMAMSMVAASMMFMSQTETYGTMNYRMMSQARYGAESGVHKTTNYLLSDGYALLKPGTAGDPLTNYNLTVSPVTYNGLPVVLSTVSSQASELSDRCGEDGVPRSRARDAQRRPHDNPLPRPLPRWCRCSSPRTTKSSNDGRSPPSGRLAAAVRRPKKSGRRSKRR